MVKRIVNAIISILILATLVGLPVSLVLGEAGSGSQSVTVTVTAIPAFVGINVAGATNPLSIIADGTSTSTVTATVNDQNGDPVVDGTNVVFVTDKGSFDGNLTTTKTTTDGVATATLTSSATDEIATVTITANGVSVATAVFFIPEGDAQVEASKTEKTGTGEQTIDAKTEADTEVTKSGDGTPTVTVVKYESNPGGSAPSGFQAAGNYIDVHTDNVTAVNNILIKNYYTDADITGLTESSLRMRWWNGSAWVLCSASGVIYPAGAPTYRGYVWAEIRGDTTPDLTALTGAVFTAMGTPTPPPAPPPAGGGGGGGGPPPVRILTVNTPGSVTTALLKPDGTLLQSLIIADPSFNIILGLDSGTKILCTDDRVPERLGVTLSEEPPPVPEGFAAVSPVYDLIAYIPGRVPDSPGVPRPVTFDPPITLQISYDPEELPENASSVFIAYHDEEEGWTQLEPPSDFVAAVGIAGAQVSHFTPFVVMTDLVALPARFEVRNLDINPIQVMAGENVTISALLVNIGGLRGEYNLVVNIEGLLETSQVIRLTPGQSQVITFTITPGSPGNYQVAIGDSRGNFGVEAIPIAPAVGVVVSGWLIAVVSAVAVIAALAIIAAKKGLQPALAVETGVYRWLLPGMSAGAAVSALAFTTARERLQYAPAVGASVLYRWLLPGMSAVAAVAALAFTTAREYLQRALALVLKKPPKPVPGAFRPSNVAAVAALAFTTARERLQRAAVVKKPPKPVPGAFRPSNVAAVAALAFTTARERLQRAAVVKKPPEPVPSAFRVSNLKIIPGRAKPYGSVTIIAEAVNIGPVRSSYSLVLKIKGMVEAVKEITLSPGQSQKVAFAILKNKPGVYDVDLEGLKGSFTVDEEIAAPPDSSLSSGG